MSGPLRLLAIGRLHPDEKKGIDSLLCALARLPATDFALTVIGEGAARPTLQRLAEELGVAARVRFLGAVPRPPSPTSIAISPDLWATSRPPSPTTR